MTGYDPKCEELARYFLGLKANPERIAALAQELQDEVEFFIDTEDSPCPLCGYKPLNASAKFVPKASLKKVKG